MTKPQYLVDRSVFLNIQPENVAEVLGPPLEAGEAATCAVVDVALLSRISDPVVRAEVAATRAAAFQWLETTDQNLRRALEVQVLLDHDAAAAAWPELLVAAVAEAHGVTLLHHNPVFDRIAEVTGQSVEWAR